MPIHKRSLWIFLLLATVIIAGSLYGFYEKDQVMELDGGGKKEQVADEMITIYVSGAVNKPGVLKIKQSARVVEAIEACGGLLTTADAGKINMAQKITDGSQIHVPEKKLVLEQMDTKTKGMDGADNPSSGGKININTADQAELDKLPGVGPATAAAIIEYRKTEGQFKTIEDLKNIRGIGEAKFKKLADHITI
ncbi:helix-hairpin-helix domain-containing protein [Anaerosinus massiliensis]|uniref:helix-hairpin-helix domain-containing protein n=1 Tax=Massilibacillus massiliensis TaxID=1806837 RepID=UPI000DA62524|nr:helix-hairpin-helix domain-containing protein [Massilibacillus massiliensis]